MIVVCGGIKGGSGKTTAATNLAIIRASEGHDVLLIDADDQETSSEFTQLRSEKVGNAGYTSIKLTGAAVRTQTLRLSEKYSDIVIDTGGRDTTSQRGALAVADLLLVPFLPRSFDVWTLDRVAELLADMQPVNPTLKAATFLNRADSRGQDNEDTAEVLREKAKNSALQFSNVTLVNRKAFSNAAAGGLAVTELKPVDPKACEEIMELYRYVFNTNVILNSDQSNTVPVEGGER